MTNNSIITRYRRKFAIACQSPSMRNRVNDPLAFTSMYMPSTKNQSLTNTEIFCKTKSFEVQLELEHFIYGYLPDRVHTVAQYFV